MRWKYGGNGKYEPLPPNIRVVEFDLSDSWQMQSDIDAMMTNRHGGSSGTKNNWEYQDESTIFRSSISPRHVKSYEPGRGYDVARDGVDRSVQQIGRT